MGGHRIDAKDGVELHGPVSFVGQAKFLDARPGRGRSSVTMPASFLSSMAPHGGLDTRQPGAGKAVLQVL
jgi:hypothetical protein